MRRVFREGKLGAGNQAHSVRLPTAQFQGHHHIRNQKGMFKKESSKRAVLRAPAQVTKGLPQLLFQERSSFIAETVDYLPTSSLVIVIELGAGTLQKAVVVEELKTS